MTASIPLTNSYSSTMVDEEDLEEVLKRKWYFDRDGHVRSTDHSRIYLHHLINGKPPRGLETDHHDSNGLNNRRSNLRNATHAQNSMNRSIRCDNVSGFRGVFWIPGRERWQAQIQANGRRKSLGYFSDQIEAAEAYDKAAKKLFGEFARPNFPMRFPRLMRFPRE